MLGKSVEMTIAISVDFFFLVLEWKYAHFESHIIRQLAPKMHDHAQLHLSPKKKKWISVFVKNGVAKLKEYCTQDRTNIKWGESIESTNDTCIKWKCKNMLPRGAVCHCSRQIFGWFSFSFVAYPCHAASHRLWLVLCARGKNIMKNNRHHLVRCVVITIVISSPERFTADFLLFYGFFIPFWSGHTTLTPNAPEAQNCERRLSHAFWGDSIFGTFSFVCVIFIFASTVERFYGRSNA